MAIYGLRQALRNNVSDISHVLFQNDCYQLNPKLRLWVDYEIFTKKMTNAQTLERQGEMENAIREFSSAEALYQGEFMEEDRYEDWLLPQRQRLQDEYLKLLDSLTTSITNKMISLMVLIWVLRCLQSTLAVKKLIAF